MASFSEESLRSAPSPASGDAASGPPPLPPPPPVAVPSQDPRLPPPPPPASPHLGVDAEQGDLAAASSDDSAGRSAIDAILVADGITAGETIESPLESGVEVIVTEDDEEPPVVTFVRVAPPWLVSCIVHAALVIVLALIPYLILREQGQVELTAAYTDRVGEQLQLETFSEVDLLAADESIQLNAEDLEPVDEPLPLTAPAPLTPDGSIVLADIGPSQMGLLLSGREKGMKELLLGAYGGSDQTESAVFSGLGWLARTQDSDGTWSLSGRYRKGAHSRSATYADGGQIENKTAATAMALLAFQGYGQTHRSGPHEEFRRVVERAVIALKKRQASDGSFTKHIRRDEKDLQEFHLMYTQALCTFSLCELYAMTGDGTLRPSAQRAVDYLVKNQDRQGGWRYAPGSGSDLSVTGWVMMAMQSARMAELDVPSKTLYGIDRFLDKTQKEGGSRYAYMPYREWSLPMTAEGLLCRQYLGWHRDANRLVAGAELLDEHPISESDQDVYYWYYATQVLHNMEGPLWDRWNQHLSTKLPALQDKAGAEEGSWSPKRDAHGESGGRLYTTCLSLYMLEVYYRHLPIYSLDLDLKADGK